jgi:hypothetical protein
MERHTAGSWVMPVLLENQRVPRLPSKRELRNPNYRVVTRAGYISLL